MARRPTLLLPGEGQGPELASWRPVFAFLLALLWLVFRASALPRLGLGNLVFDPLIPLVGAFALTGRVWEAWAVGLGIGWLADSMPGRETGRTLFQYAGLVALTLPLHGRVVLRDRLVPAVGIALASALSSVGLGLVLMLMDANQKGHWRHIPQESGGAAVATLLVWPLLRRIAGADEDRPLLLGRRR